MATDASLDARTANGPLADLSIRFLKRGPDEELVQFIRTCAMKLTRDGKLEVTIEPHRHGIQVQLHGSAWSYPVIETDPDPHVAARRAFERWAAMLEAEARFTQAKPAGGARHADTNATMHADNAARHAGRGASAHR